MLEKIHAECEHFWERHAGEIATGKRARIDSTGCSEKWMKNTQVVHDAFERSGCGTLLGPRFMCGLPAWLKDVASCGTASRGYYIPPVGELIRDQHCCAITVWSSRQWPSPVRACVLSEISNVTAGLREFRESETVFAVLRVVRDRLERDIAPQLMTFYGAEDAHSLLACAHNLLAQRGTAPLLRAAKGNPVPFTTALLRVAAEFHLGRTTDVLPIDKGVDRAELARIRASTVAAAAM